LVVLHPPAWQPPAVQPLQEQLAHSGSFEQVSAPAPVTVSHALLTHSLWSQSPFVVHSFVPAPV
jgi:hypothetical protein